METIKLFEGVEKGVIDKLLQDKYNAWRTYNEGDYIVRQGTLCRSLHILVKGTLTANMTNAEGRELTIERLSAPELLAPAFLFGEENRFPVTLKAESHCELCIIGKRNFLEFMHNHPSVMENFIAQISNRCVFLSHKLNEFALQNLRFRVLNYLKQHGVITNQQEVSLHLGVARPSLARVLSELLKEKVLVKQGNSITITAVHHENSAQR